METEYVLALCFLSFLGGVEAWMILSALIGRSIEKKYPRSK